MGCCLFDKLTSLEHLFDSWDVFKRGKRNTVHVQIFERYLEDNIFGLRDELATFTYQHGRYFQFDVFDPKRRHINAASVKDRLLHQAVFSILSDIMEKKFIFHSFSSRVGKGTHLACEHLKRMIYQVSGNGMLPCHSLKMDVRQFFAQIDHHILKQRLREAISDNKMLWICDSIIDSFHTQGMKHVGLPLGNVTSQLFANVYLHDLDIFMKQIYKQKFYIRFCDDFILLSQNKAELLSLISPIRFFLANFLHLELHPKKIIYRSLHQGIDFLGYIHFFHHRLVRTTTKRRMVRKLDETLHLFFEEKLSASSFNQSLQSYLGLLSHANHYDLSQTLKNMYPY